jgi:hypothetical protein
VVRPVVVAVAVVPGAVVGPLPLMMGDPVMLAANVVGGVVAAMTRLGDGWSRDPNGGGEREE